MTRRYDKWLKKKAQKRDFKKKKPKPKVVDPPKEDIDWENWEPTNRCGKIYKYLLFDEKPLWVNSLILVWWVLLFVLFGIFLALGPFIIMVFLYSDNPIKELIIFLGEMIFSR